MFGLHGLDTANVFIFSGQLPQSWAPANIIAGPWVNPDIIYLMVFTERYDINPFQDIGADIRRPTSNILFSGAYINRP